MLSWLLFSNTSCRTGSSCDFVFFCFFGFFLGFFFSLFWFLFKFLGGGEEKGAVAEVCVTRGVRVMHGVHVSRVVCVYPA